jgi:N4-gp56 family major capsid protein
MTNFAALLTHEKKVWRRKLWRAGRNSQFLAPHIGDDDNSMVQRISELKKTEKGTKAVITLVHDLEGDGVAGDRTLEGNEEAGQASDIAIQIDQLRHATRHEGRMAEQKSVVGFRETALNNLGYWLGDRTDQLAILTMSGVSYTKQTNGADRVGSDFPFLEFAGDVTAPTANRHFRVDGSGALQAADTSAIAAGHVPTWDMMIDLKAYAEEQFIRPLRGEGGLSFYKVFMTPTALAALKKDQKFHDALKDAMGRGPGNPLFKGAMGYYIDGLFITTHRHVYNTTGAAAGSKWGGSGTVDGCRMLFCGAQALGYADLGAPDWVEKGFDYENQQAIATGKIMGFKKPVFKSQKTGTQEDFGVICVDMAHK